MIARRLVAVGKVFAVVTVVLSLGVWLASILDQPEFAEWDDPWQQTRAHAVAQEYMVVAGTPWAAQSAADILESGGNAFDAAVAGLLVLNVTFGEAASFPGIAPLMIYDAANKETRSYVGVGTAPAAATIDAFTTRGFDVVPKMDIYSQLIPASPDVIATLLSEYGTKSFKEVSAAAIKIAEEGFPVHKIMQRNLDLNIFERLGFNFLLPYNSKVYLDNRWWRPLRHKQKFTRPDLAKTLTQLAQAETDALLKGGDRNAGLQAMRGYFYTGPLAEKIVQLHEEKSGLISAADLADYSGYWEEPLSGEFQDFEIRTNSTWTQGIVVPMVLQILDGVDLNSMGHNSEQYVHTVAQAIELVMADREAFVGDPEFVDVPLEQLLSKDYAALRRALISDKAFDGMPIAGAPVEMQAVGQRIELNTQVASLYNTDIGRDTSYLSIVDKDGNAVSMTPSDFPHSPMVTDTGMTMGIRMTQFRLDPNHPTSLEPGKRPRVTPHAVMIFNQTDQSLYMSLGTPGADMQTQALVQVLLNHLVFEMDIQTAIEQPRFRSQNLPSSFSPHSYSPATLDLEEELYQAISTDLNDRGYTTNQFERLHNHFSAVGAVVVEGGRLSAGADPREGTTAVGRQFPARTGAFGRTSPVVFSYLRALTRQNIFMKSKVLKKVALFAEILGGLAVFLSIIYLAVEVRANTNAIQSQTNQGLVELANEVNHQKSAYAELWVRGSADLDALDENELLQYQLLWLSDTNIWEQAFNSYNSGTLSTELWRAWDGDLARKRVCVESGKAVWELLADAYGPEFQAHIATVMLECPMSSEDSKTNQRKLTRTVAFGTLEQSRQRLPSQFIFYTQSIPITHNQKRKIPMRKYGFLIALLTLVFTTGCAGITKLYGEYNPDRFPSSELATIFEKKRSFGQRFIEQTYYRILATNGAYPDTIHNGFSKFAPGVHFIDWVYIEMVDGGMWTTHEVRSSGRLLVTLEKAANYRLGKKDDETQVSVWHEASGQTVSQPCLTDCKQEKSELTGVPLYLSK